MKFNSKALKLRRALALAGMLSWLSLMAVAAPFQDETATRRLWDTDYLKAKSKASAGKTPTPKRRYRVVTPQIPANEVAGESVLGIVAEPSHRNTRADRLGLGWNDGINAALLESGVDLGVGIACIGGHCFRSNPRA